MSTEAPLTWASPSPALTLPPDEIHVWKATLAMPASYVDLLSDEERQRAIRFLLEKHRHRFIAGRAILRVILGHYLGLNPSHVRLQYHSGGKPEVRSESAESLRFNLSHSGDLALYAVTRNDEVGIDLECLRPFPEALDLARRFFSTVEQEWLFTQDFENRNRAFFRIWTLKEAYMKAHGHGLGFPLDQFSVVPEIKGQTELYVYEFEPEVGYLAALIAQGKRKRLKGCLFTPLPWPSP